MSIRAIRFRNVLGYVFLPGIIPRIRAFGKNGFGYVAYLIATLYGMVRILPPTHPYLNTANVGKYGVRHVIAQAANHIVVKKENIDQILIFTASLAAFVLLIVQIVMLVYSLIVTPAHAQFANPFMGFFSTPLPQDDIAYNILDRVFGVPDFFCNFGGACTAIQGNLPFPFHVAMHSLFQFYSLAILLFAVLIFLYYVLVVIGETAQTGTPFGRRFNKVWAPLRLVVAIGLLVPINYGLNSGQYIVLASAKYGSSLATNGWLIFNRSLSASMASANPVGANQYTAAGTQGSTLVALPNAPDITAIVGFMTLANVCRVMYADVYNLQIVPYLVKNPGVNQPLGVGASFQNALNFYEGGEILIRFGHWGTTAGGGELYPSYEGFVKPFCGDIVIHAGEINQQPGSLEVQEAYFNEVLQLWNNTQLYEFGRRMSYIHDHLPTTDPTTVVNLVPDNPDRSKPPLASWRQTQLNAAQGAFEAEVVNAWQVLRSSGIFEIDPEILERGWGGAGIWYNRIAQFNGTFISAVMNVPTPIRYPLIMETVANEKRKQDSTVTGWKTFEPNLSNGQEINYERASDSYLASAFYETMRYHMEEEPNQASTEMRTSQNIIDKVITTVFGTYGLFNIRKNENQNIHPLAQLVGVGKGLIDSSIRNLALSIGFAAGGGALQALKFTDMGAAAEAMSGMFLSFTMIGLVAGFVLFYIIPFLPFIYFFFAVGGWVKSIFEAMVGVPLWALAHLRIDGNGLPGDQAANGYFLIFEIFLRPILCVFGLLAGMAVFAAMARVLHDIFNLVISNLTGFEDDQASDPLLILIQDVTGFKRSSVDEFFFTIMYTMILYMMATASFKMIDMVPNNILRWAGAGVSSFGDSRDDPTQGLIRYAAIGGATVGGQVTSGLQQGGKLAGSATGGILSAFGLGARGGGRVTLAGKTSK